MIRNVMTGEWLHKKSGKIIKWTPKMEKATLWQAKSGPIQTMKHNHLDATVAEMVTFTLVEEE